MDSASAEVYGRHRSLQHQDQLLGHNIPVQQSRLSAGFCWVTVNDSSSKQQISLCLYCPAASLEKSGSAYLSSQESLAG
ncbi:hypothetical protein EYF80_020668 [Liparis tanakae]|uniref:Uncharacterized protein n=1 Tax=Liparis tanakae TaxID=230148 RepID=A0A4Z2HUW1_9TELE|nr:hypothetical protein EYF80_020668 [Liparis tanakae]